MLTISLLMWLVLLALPIYGYKRGSSTAFFTSIFIGVAGLLSYFIAMPVADLVPLGDPAHVRANQGMWSLIVFIPLMLTSFPLGIYVSRFSQWSFDPFDAVIGLYIGMAAGLLTAWMLAMMITQSVEGLAAQQQLQQLFVIRQFGYYEWWHTLSAWMANAGNPPQ
ncbi:MAG: CvpA family protein [Armatimonadota bacterium]